MVSYTCTTDRGKLSFPFLEARIVSVSALAVEVTPPCRSSLSVDRPPELCSHMYLWLEKSKQFSAWIRNSVTFSSPSTLIGMHDWHKGWRPMLQKKWSGEVSYEKDTELVDFKNLLKRKRREIRSGIQKTPCCSLAKLLTFFKPPVSWTDQNVMKM